MRWHNSHKSSYRDSAGTYWKFTNTNNKRCDKLVPVTTACRVVGFLMEERPPIWSVAVNILNKQPRTADKGWSSNVGRGANNFSP